MSAGLVESGLVAADAQLEAICEGFVYTEGPVWDPRDETLLFSEIVKDTRFRWSRRDGCVVDRHPNDYANGMAFEADGRLLICTIYGLKRREHDGSLSVVASHYDGKELNSPNDVAVRSNGDIYFTDPRYGRIPVYGVDRPQQLPFQGLYRLRAADGVLELLSDDFEDPNGIVFSPDESRLYVDDSGRANVRVFDVDADGALSNDRVFQEHLGPALDIEDVRRDDFPTGYVDGMACDERGNVYVTGPGGVWVFEPGGENLGVIELPDDVANVTWGGQDFRTLYFACRNAIRRLPMEVRGTVMPGHGIAGQRSAAGAGE